MNPADKKEIRTISILINSLDNPSYRDPLLKLGTLSPHFTLCRMLDDQESFKSIVENVTSPVIESLNNSLTQTENMREITTMAAWPNGLKKFIHMSNNCEISK